LGTMLTASSRIVARIHEFPATTLREVPASRLFRLEVCQNTWRLGNLAELPASCAQSARYERHSGKDIAELPAVDSPGVTLRDVV
jgi:hypothetical protein